MLRDFDLLGVRSVAELAKQDPVKMYARLERLTGQRQDPCVLDTFQAAVAQARNPRLPAFLNEVILRDLHLGSSSVDLRVSRHEHGVSLARVRYAFNSTNVEGWGLYSEYLIKPYMPLEGQLISLQMRLQRAARAFLDPELQSGKVAPQDAYRVLEQDVVLSHAMAQQEVERYTYRAPGQANSYFYGYTRLLSLREETEKALSAKGVKFDQKKFHNFILAQGLLPPDLMRKAVLEDFIPSQGK